MNRLGPEASRLVGQVVLAVVLSAVHRRRRGGGTLPGGTVARNAVAGALAAGGPAVAIVRARRCGQWRWPATPGGRALLLMHAASAATVEELIWRAPLLHVSRPGPRLVAAAAGATCFAAAHVGRDGVASAPVHAGNALGWTLATLAGRRIRWPILAHAGYDVAALTLHAARPEVPR